jgi:hypothetical protein
VKRTGVRRSKKIGALHAPSDSLVTAVSISDSDRAWEREAQRAGPRPLHPERRKQPWEFPECPRTSYRHQGREVAGVNLGGQATCADPVNGVMACVDELFTVYNRKPTMPPAPVQLLAGGCGTARKVGQLRPGRARSGRKTVLGGRRPGAWPNLRFSQPLASARLARFQVRLVIRAHPPARPRTPAWAVRRDPEGQATRANPVDGVVVCVDELYTVYNRKPAMPQAPVQLLGGGWSTVRKVGRPRPGRERSGRKMVLGGRRPGAWPNPRFAQPLASARPARFQVRLVIRAHPPARPWKQRAGRETGWASRAGRRYSRRRLLDRYHR